MYVSAYRGYRLAIRLKAGSRVGETECAILHGDEEISVEESSARARAVVDEWLNAR